MLKCQAWKLSQGRIIQEETGPVYVQACPLSSSDAGMWRMPSVHLIHCSAPGGGSPVSTLAAIAPLGSGRQAGRQAAGGAHPQRDLLETPSSGEHERILRLRSDDTTTFRVLRYPPKDITAEAGVGYAQEEAQADIIIRCAVWGEVTADYHGKTKKKKKQPGCLSIRVFYA